MKIAIWADGHFAAGQRAWQAEANDYHGEDVVWYAGTDAELHRQARMFRAHATGAGREYLLAVAQTIEEALKR